MALLAVLAAGCSSTPQAGVGGTSSISIAPTSPGPSGGSSPAAGSTPSGGTASIEPPVLSDPDASGGPADPTVPTQSAASSAPASSSGSPTARSGDRSMQTVVTALASALQSGDRTAFLAPFIAALAHRVGAWFDNSRSLGVSGALFSVVPGQLTGDSTADGSAGLTRTVVLGVRTPYDDPASLPGLSYRISVIPDGTGWQITRWDPVFVSDPVNCDCTLEVAADHGIAVVSRADSDLADWPTVMLKVAREAVNWSNRQLAGTGLNPLAGHIFFLTDQPYHWYGSPTDPAQTSNITYPLPEAGGPTPGSGVSLESRVVLELASGSGRLLSPYGAGRQYASDVVAHEITHQLLLHNSALQVRSGLAPLATWVVEGAAVAMEVVHRWNQTPDGDPGAGVDYPLPDDLDNVDPAWIAAHLSGPLPTDAQLYQGDTRDRNDWYALCGTVYLYLYQTWGMTEMLAVAHSVYQVDDSTPFQFFPDPDHPGSMLTPTKAEAAWRAWALDRYDA